MGTGLGLYAVALGAGGGGTRRTADANGVTGLNPTYNATWRRGNPFGAEIELGVGGMVATQLQCGSEGSGGACHYGSDLGLSGELAVRWRSQPLEREDE
jgi:hypothetical protein